jgi:tetratricopeptide (TPR) repeat protein
MTALRALLPARFKGSLRAIPHALIACSLLLAFASLPAAAKGPGDRATGFFLQGNAAYEKGDFAAAVDAYRKALDEGAVNDRLYFNYANALFRQSQLGMAILYYEKARKLAPNDEDIAFNLRFANAQTVDKNPVPEPDLLTKSLWVFHSAYSINQGMWIALGLFSACFLFGIFAIYAGKGFRGVLVSVIVLCGLGLLVLVPSLVYKIRQQETVRYAIVLTPALEMYSGPGDNYQVLTKVHEGTKFEIVEVRGDWASVKLLNGKGGYVRYADLGKV